MYLFMTSHNRTAPMRREGKMKDDEDDISALRRIVAPGFGNILNVIKGDFSKVPSRKMMKRLDKLEDVSEERHYGTKYGTHFPAEDVYKTTREEVFFTKFISDDVMELVEKAMAIEIKGFQAAEEEQKHEEDESEEEDKKSHGGLIFTKFVSDGVKELIKEAMSFEIKDLYEAEEQEDEYDEDESEDEEEESTRSLIFTKFLSDDIEKLIKEAMAIEIKELYEAEEEQEDEYHEEESEEEDEKSHGGLIFTKFVSGGVKELIKEAMAIEIKGLQVTEEEKEDENNEQESEKEESRRSLIFTKFISDGVKELIKKTMAIEIKGLQAVQEGQKDGHDEQESEGRDEKGRRSLIFTKLVSDDMKEVIKKAMAIKTKGLQVAGEQQKDEYDVQESEDRDEKSRRSLIFTKFLSDDVKKFIKKATAIETKELYEVEEEQEDQYHEEESEKEESRRSRFFTNFISDDTKELIKKAMAIETKGLRALEKEQKDEHDEQESEEEAEEKSNTLPANNAHGPDNVIGIPKEATPAMRKAFSNLCTSSSGVLFENQLLQVDLKHEYNGCRGMVEVFFGNLSSSSLTTFKCDVDQADHFALDIEGTPGLLESGCIVPVQSRAKLVILVKVKAPFDDAPAMIISFQSDGERHVYALRLPIVATCFMDPLILDAGAFMQRWKSLDGQERECQQVFTASQNSTPIDVNGMMRIARIVTEGLKFTHSEGCDPTPWTVSGAATFRTGANDANGNNINVDCLVRVEANPKAGAYRVTTRSLHPICSRAVKNIATISIKLA